VACVPTRANDASAALEELRQGYALKHAGQCDKAMLYFWHSFRLDPKGASAHIEASPGEPLAATVAPAAAEPVAAPHE
jgi:hypothetical protein